jgi:hypothetical protein
MGWSLAFLRDQNFVTYEVFLKYSSTTCIPIFETTSNRLDSRAKVTLSYHKRALSLTMERPRLRYDSITAKPILASSTPRVTLTKKW